MDNDPASTTIISVLGIFDGARPNGRCASRERNYGRDLFRRPADPTHGSPDRSLCESAGGRRLGHAKIHGQWHESIRLGLVDTGKYFLDGVETPLGDINALGLSDEEFEARVTKEVGPSDNSLGFTGLNFVDQPRGETFVAGRLFYHNGVNALGTSVSSVNFDVQSSSVSPDFSQLLSLEIAIRTSPNVLNPDGTLNNEASADFIFFVDRPDLGSFRVYEQQGTDVEILMEFNSLDLVGFGAVGDPAVGFISAFVPEPSTACLAGMMLVVLLNRRCRGTRPTLC